jgi:predicted neutral ceramidase superfamily lipid hydrolase
MSLVHRVVAKFRLIMSSAIDSVFGHLLEHEFRHDNPAYTMVIVIVIIMIVIIMIVIIAAEEHRCG